MSGQQPRKLSGEHTASGHNMSGQHRQHLHNPTGYTDEVAEEEHEFLEQAERSAGEGTERTTGGMESSSGTGSNLGQKASSTMENVKNKAKETLNLK